VGLGRRGDGSLGRRRPDEQTARDHCRDDRSATRALRSPGDWLPTPSRSLPTLSDLLPTRIDSLSTGRDAMPMIAPPLCTVHTAVRAIILQ
jgi:hypothetical protein